MTQRAGDTTAMATLIGDRERGDGTKDPGLPRSQRLPHGDRQLLIRRVRRA